MPLDDGQEFAGFVILRHLGSGGMGEIYLAQHPRLPRQEALKVLPTEVTGDHEYRERFLREADIAASLWHPHIVAVHDRGEFDGQLWISMDFVEGTDASLLLDERYPNGMPPEDVVKIVTGVADALDYAHQRQLLHRDVKPSNILLAQPDSGSERVLLADFGIARRVDDQSGLTGTNMTVGTVAYAAPEQLMGETIDGRADQYALAASAYHLMTGAPVFQHSNPAVVISQHLSAAPPAIESRRPDLTGLGPVFSKALAKSPDDRYERCLDFARALEHRLGTVATETGAADDTIASLPASGPRHRQATAPRRPRPRLRPAVVIAAVLALLLIAVSAIALLLFKDELSSSTASSPSVPVVVNGADCDQGALGTAGKTAQGEDAVCARLSTSGGTITVWSENATSNQVPPPTVTPNPGEETHPPDIEQQVRLCVQESGKSRLECREDIKRENKTGPA